MAKRYLTAAKAVVGASLPWNIFNEEGRLLLKAGEEITSELQAYRLATQGLYFDEGTGAETGLAEREPPSVVRMLNLADKLMRQTLPKLQEGGDAEARVIAIAQLVSDALDLNADVAVAYILLGGEAAFYVYRHCIHAAVVAALIGREMQQNRNDELIMIAAALTQNIGMLQYQDVLNSKRGSLSEQELTVVKQHPVHGVSILKAAGVTNEAWLECVLSHHETEDGTGYPSGKGSDALSLATKLIGFADRYCSRLVDKKYAKRRVPNLALREVLLSHGEHPPTLMAAHFIRTVGMYPPGSTVLLKNGEIGVVLKKGAAPNGAIIRVTITKSGMPTNELLIRDTENPEYAIKEGVFKEDAGTHLAMSRFWGDVASG